MSEGRKSRWGFRALFCALAAFALAGASPATVAASPAEDEYDLDLPSADGGSNEPTPQSAEDSSASSAPSTPDPAEPTIAGDDDTPTAAPGAAGGSGGSGGGSDGGGGGGGGGGQASSADAPGQGVASTAADEPASTLPADGSDDGGVSVLLILLAIAAAVCAGVAFWRLRRNRDHTDDTGHDPGARPGDVARGTQSS